MTSADDKLVDDIPKEPYDSETLKRITEVLKVPNLSEEQTAKLQHAAWVYLSALSR